METPSANQQYAHKLISYWLLLNVFLIFCMVLVGGLTRLTGSGLSMVHWEPIKALLPPLNLSEWETAFQAYQLSPEYLKVNLGMTLGEFKRIFYWEYGHRALGRIIGLVYFLPLVYFHIKFNLAPRLIAWLYFGLILGGSQGLLGWYMVKSGLIDNPHVSHYRLAAHLILAFFVAAYLFWLSLSLRQDSSNTKIKAQKFISTWRVKEIVPLISLSFLLLAQIFYGALTAGLHAGRGFNTFPHMNGSYFPFQWFNHQPYILNFIESHVGVQWMHRSLAWGLVVMTLLFGYLTKKHFKNHAQLKKSYFIFLSFLFLQFLLGITALLTVVKIQWASLHQLGAFLLMLSFMSLWFDYIRFARNHRALKK